VVLIFGWGSGQAKDLGEVAPARCPRCRNDVYLHFVKSEKRVSLYFVPLVPYGSDEYLLCPICGNGLQVRPEHRPAIDRMRAATAAHRRAGGDDAYYLQTVQAFWARLGVAPSGQRVVAAPAGVPPGPDATATSAPAPPSGPSLAEQLGGLGRLHAEGVLSDEEFTTAKRRLLGG